MLDKLSVDDIDLFVFDFDGVLTNNLVFVDCDGIEYVACSRADGLAFDAFRKLKKHCFILSTEKNSVVSKRGEKLNIPVLQGVEDKLESLRSLCADLNVLPERVMYVGNDLNDFKAMSSCGYRCCPNDAHPAVKKLSNINLDVNGGHGVAREILERWLKIDIYELLFAEET